jgi:hypothetical protein
MNKVIKYLQKLFTIAPSIGCNGSALIATVVSITVVGILATAIMYIVSSSSNVPAGANLSMRVYYLAESGIRYIDPPDTQPVEAAVNGSASVTNPCMSQSNPTLCLQNLASCLNQPTSTCLASNTEYVNPAYTSNTYTLDGGNTTIALAASYIAGPPQQIQLTSTATVNPTTSGTAGAGQSALPSARTITLQSNSIIYTLTNCDVETNPFASFGTVTVTVPPGGGSATFTVSLNAAALGPNAEVEDIFINTTPSALTSSLLSSGTITPSSGIYAVHTNQGAGSVGTNYDWKIDTGGADPGSAGLPQNFAVTFTNANITSASNFIVPGNYGSAGMSNDTFYIAVEITDVNPCDLLLNYTGKCTNLVTEIFGAQTHAP